MGNPPVEKRKNGRALEPQEFNYYDRNGYSFSSVALIIDWSYSDDLSDSDWDIPVLGKDVEVYESFLGWFTGSDVTHGYFHIFY